MSDKSGWVNVSLTLSNGRILHVDDAHVTFPGLHEKPDWIPGSDDFVDETYSMRIETSKPSSIPILNKGDLVMFQGVYAPRQLQFSVNNAKVYESAQGVLVLEAKPADGVTCPVSTAVL